MSETEKTTPEFSLADLPESLKPLWEELREFINTTPVVTSLLYDLDLMPEQIRSPKMFERMLLIAGHFRQHIVENPTGIRVHCDKCKELLKSEGALAFAPPFYDQGRFGYIAGKFHFCGKCWLLLLEWMK